MALGKTLLIIGAGPDQCRAIKVAKEMGLRVAAIDRDDSAVGASSADIFAPISTDDRYGALAFARQVCADGVMTAISETGVPVVSFVGETLGLPAPSQLTARLATNKNDMRRAFAEHRVPTVRSMAVQRISEAREFVEECGLPVVLKPSDSSGQSGVSVVANQEGLESALTQALHHSTDQTAIIEQFVDGPEINVCAVAHAGEIEILSMSYRRTLPPPFFGIAYQHIYPLSVNPDTGSAIRDAAESAIHAIGLREGIAYPQLILSSGGPVVIEIAARVPGGYMCELAELASGIDMIRIAILMATRQPFDLDCLRLKDREDAVIVDFYTALSLPERTTVLHHLSGVEEASKAPGIVKAEFLIRPGDRIPPLTSSRGRFGAVVAVGKSVEEASDRLTNAKNSICIY